MIDRKNGALVPAPRNRRDAPNVTLPPRRLTPGLPANPTGWDPCSLGTHYAPAVLDLSTNAQLVPETGGFKTPCVACGVELYFRHCPRGCGRLIRVGHEHQSDEACDLPSPVISRTASPYAGA